MNKETFYTLPALSYGYKDLEPYISEKQIQTHRDKHHQTYVKALVKSRGLNCSRLLPIVL